MKKIFSLILLLGVFAVNSFAISYARLDQVIREIQSCFPSNCSFKLEFIPTGEFEKEQVDFQMRKSTMAFTRLYEHSDGTFAYGKIVLREEILYMTDEFFDKHYASILAHEFCHIYQEEHVEKGSQSHGPEFKAVQYNFNKAIERKNDTRYFKYWQYIDTEPYDYELNQFFDNYRNSNNRD